MSVTTNDIARICQVSRTTVIRALNNQGRISKETKDRIVKIAEELGYRPDLLARGLVKGKTMYIGVVVFDVKNQYFAQMLSAIETEAQTRGYCVNITLHGKKREKEVDLIRKLVDYHVDGLILSPVNKGKQFNEFLQSLDTPLVIIGNKVSDEIPFVGIDERRAAKEATNRIMNSGYERVVFVCPPLGEPKEGNNYTHEQRLEGFMEAAGVRKGVETVIVSSESYKEEAACILESGNRRTAFFCSGDIYAVDIMKYLKFCGKQTPGDYGIMGFDDIELLEYLSPRLSTIYNSVEEVAKKAVELLFDEMDGKKIAMETYEAYRIVQGETL